MGTWWSKLSSVADGSKRTRKAKETHTLRVYVCAACKRSDVTLVNCPDEKKRCPECKQQAERLATVAA